MGSIALTVPISVNGEVWRPTLRLKRKRDGSLELVEGEFSPLSRLHARDRLRLVLAALEMAAVQGDVQAAKVYLDWRRWRVEMEKGRPANRTELSVKGNITVVDDVGRRPVIDVGSGALLPVLDSAALPTPYSKTGPEPDRKGLPAAAAPVVVKRERRKRAESAAVP